MASISPPTPPHKLSFRTHRRFLPKRPSYPSPSPSPFPSHSFSWDSSDSSSSAAVGGGTSRCRCTNSSSSDSSSSEWRWDAALQGFIGSAMKRINSFISPRRKEDKELGNVMDVERDDGKGEKEWDWNRWRRHFEEVDEQERVVSVLKSQLDHAVKREDYDDAARLKVAIAAAATNDAVGRVMSQLNRAVAEERYQDAALLRDYAGTGLVGWWSGISEDVHDPYGLIIRITAEHGRYVARSYSPRQLATAAVGVPVFEIFLTKNRKGEYKQQAVYLKRKGFSQDSSTVSSKSPGATNHLNPPGTVEDKSDLLVVSTEDAEDGDDTEDGSDLNDGLPGFQNILRDMIPGVKVKVLKVTAPAKVDRDFISKVIEQIMDEEDDEKDIELESIDSEDEVRGESDQERDEIEMDATHGIIDNEGPSEISVKVVVGGLTQKLSGSMPMKQSLRVPAKLEKKGRRSFCFSIEKDVNQQDSGAKEAGSLDKKAKFQGQRSVDSIMLDLAKFIGREKIPLKVLKDVGDLINFTLSQAQNRQPLSGSTTFHRIEISTSPDPLNGLYIGAHGLYTSEVIHLQRKFGQWQDERGTKEPSSLEFYEYVEAVKLTGDPYVPAGQVAFRAKVGKRYQLPHKGIIPEEFGVIARYRGQGRLAEPGFQNPRWVDGELVILDGKYIKGGPVVGFVYWAPEYHFLNEIILASLRNSGKVAVMASEEDDAPIWINDNGPFVVVTDPLDGSRNIDASIPTGTIFGVYKRLVELDHLPQEEKAMLNSLQSGTRLVAAGYVLYSSATIFCASFGSGTHAFTLDHSTGDFILTHPGIKIPPRGQIYSVNDARYFDWPEGLRQYIDTVRQGKGKYPKKYSARYICSLVADFHRTLMYGGVAMNPRDHLRLVYEANPLSFLVEQAGGRGSDGKVRILSLQPVKLHQRLSLFLGSLEDMEELESYGDVQQKVNPGYEV